MKSNIRDALEARLSVNSYLWPKNTDPYEFIEAILKAGIQNIGCLLYTSPSPRDMRRSRMPSSA